MKIKTVVLKISTLLKIGSLTSILALTGCISTSHFQSWSGQQEFEGKGGAFVTKDGIDIYSVGTPRGQGVSASASPSASVVPNASEKPKPSEVPKPTEKSVAMPTPLSPVTEIEDVAEETDTDLGNEQHNNIKHEIRDEAETLDYTATCEVDFPEVHGRADIVMERGNKKNYRPGHSDNAGEI